MSARAAALPAAVLLLLTVVSLPRADEPAVETITLHADLTLAKGQTRLARVVVRASHVVLDGNGATLSAPAPSATPSLWRPPASAS